MDASKLATGQVPLARMGAGTAAVNSWLRGDGTWGQRFQIVGGISNTSYTMQPVDTMLLCSPSTGTVTVTLPPASSAIGNEVLIYNTSGTQTVTVACQGTDKIFPTNVATLSLGFAKYIRMVAHLSGTQWWIFGSY